MAETISIIHVGVKSQRAENSLDRVDRKLDNVGDEAVRLEGRLGGLDKKFGQLGGSMRMVAGAATGLFAAFTGNQLLRQADQASELNNRLRSVSKTQRGIQPDAKRPGCHSDANTLQPRRHC